MLRAMLIVGMMLAPSGSAATSDTTLTAQSVGTAGVSGAILLSSTHQSSGTGWYLNPLIIVHDPPGDHSYGKFYKGTSTQYSVTYATESEAKASIEAGYEADVDIVNSGASVGTGFSLSVGQTKSYSISYEYSVLEEYASSTVTDDAKYIGPTRPDSPIKGGARFIGWKVKYEYDIYDDYYRSKYGILDPVTGEVYYPTFHVARIKIMLTKMIKENRWLNIPVASYDDTPVYEKYDNEYKGNYGAELTEWEFDGGTYYEKTVSYGIETSQYTARWFGVTSFFHAYAKIGGVYTKVSWKFRNRVKIKHTETTTIKVGYGYRIEDNEANDFLHFSVYRDPYTPLGFLTKVYDNTDTANPNEGY